MQPVPAQAQAHAQPPLEAEAGGGAGAGGAGCAAAEERQGAAAGAAPHAGRCLLGARSGGASDPSDPARQPAPASDGVTWALPPAPAPSGAARPAPGPGDPAATWPQPRWGPAAVMESPFRNFVDDGPDSPRGAAGGAGPAGPQEPARAPGAPAAARPASARPPARRSQSLGVGGGGGGRGGGGIDGGGGDDAWNHFSIGEGESMSQICVSGSCSRVPIRMTRHAAFCGHATWCVCTSCHLVRHRSEQPVGAQTVSWLSPAARWGRRRHAGGALHAAAQRLAGVPDVAAGACRQRRAGAAPVVEPVALGARPRWLPVNGCLMMRAGHSMC